MEQTTLGKSGIRVGRMGLGCATFGREINEAAAFEIMDYAVENGITLFDTAEAYGGGQAREYRRNYLGVDDEREVSGEPHSSEKIVGRWLKSRDCREQITLCTKVTTNHTKSHVSEALDQSLERLQTDFVDIYMYHSFDAKTPLKESVEAIDLAVKSGKIRAPGCSNYNAEQLRKSLEVSERLGLSRFEAVEPIYNLAARDIEDELLPLCREQGIGVISYSPLGAGFLTGKYTNDRAAFPKGTRFDVIPGHADVYFSDHNFWVVEQLHQFASKTGVPALQLAMAWVFQNREISTVLVGARKKEHIQNALQAVQMDFPQEWLLEMNGWREKTPA